MQQTTRRLSPREEQLIIAVDRAVYRLARHWIWLLNGVGLIFVALPILAPLLMHQGHTGTAGWIYRLFHLVCHQRDDRSFHVFGYKMAYCERDFAIYGGVFLLGIVFGLSRRRLNPARLWYAIWLSVPMALDGFTQLSGLRESNWQLRVLTGVLFAVAMAWLIFPRLEIGFAEIRQTLERRFERLVREGRAAPL